MRSIDIAPADLETVRRIWHEHMPELEVRAFGSRVSWTARATSDLDLALMTDEPLSTARMAELKAAFTKSDLPFRVDVVDWASTSENFREVIERDYVVLAERQERGPADGWRETTLGEVVTLQRGFDLPTSERKLGSYPVIASTGQVGTHNRAIVQGPGVVIGRSGSLGGGQFIKGDFWPLNTTLWVKNFKNNDPRFCYFLLKSLDLGQFNAGSGVPTLNRNHIHPLPVHVPLPLEQRAIAHILGTLDDKIELNRRMNETLEAMARALFKSWFVDFDPVRAKASLTGNRRRANRGNEWTPERARAYLDNMDEEVAALFPDSFVDSELGEIPEGWGVGCLADIAVSPRRGVDPADLRDETPYIGLEHMPRRSITLTEWGDTETVTSNKAIFEKGEILFGKLRPYFHKVGIAPVSGVCSTDIVVITPKNREWSAFVLACVSSAEFVAYTDQTSTGTKMPRTSWKVMSRYPLCLPSELVARAFQNVVAPLLDRIIANIHGSRTLAALRDTLLPKLISGELRVKKMEVATQ